jgi:hypothetical protein
LAGLAALTRYVGVAYGLAGLVVLIGAMRRHRCGGRAVAVYGLVALGPVACFLGYSAQGANTASNRSLGWHPAPPQELRAFVDTFGSWFWSNPGSAATVIGFIAIGLTFLGVAHLRRGESSERDESHYATFILGTFAVTYAVVVLLAIAFVDASIPGDAPRILLPVLPVVAVLLPAGVRAAVRGARLSTMVVAALPAVVALAVALPLTTNAIRWAKYAREQGVAVRMRDWQRMPLLARLRATPPDVTIYSNDAPLLYLLSGRHVLDVPPDVDIFTRRPLPGFPGELAHMDGVLRAGRAELVYFDNRFSPSQTRLLALLDLTPVHRSGIATVFVSARRS